MKTTDAYGKTDKCSENTNNEEHRYTCTDDIDIRKNLADRVFDQQFRIQSAIFRTSIIDIFDMFKKHFSRFIASDIISISCKNLIIVGRVSSQRLF